MPEPSVSHTVDLGPADRAALRALLDDAFEGRFDDADWDHTLGGLHVIVRHEHEIVAHAAVVQRRLVYDGRALRTGYVEGVAVAREWRGHGFGAAVMTGAEAIVRGAYDLGALSSSHRTIDWYASRGWSRWRGPTFAATPAGTVRTPEDDGGVYVLPTTVHMRLTEPLIADWRDGAVW